MFKEKQSLKTSAAKIVTASETSCNTNENSNEGSVEPNANSDEDLSVASRLKKSNKQNIDACQTSESITLAGTDRPVEYAGFVRRAFALGLDQIIILVLQWLCFSPALLAILYNESVGWTLTIVVTVAATVMQYWIYTACFEHSRWQATPGKFLVGLKVTDLQGNQLTFWRSTLRLFIQYVVLITLTLGLALLSSRVIEYSNKNWNMNLPVDNGAIYYMIALYFGYCFVLFTQKKQTLFDKAARRVVVFQPNYANSQQMTVFQCFKASILKLPQQAKLFFAHFKVNSKIERIKMSIVALICMLACGWTLFALVQVTESLVAVERAIKAETAEKETPKTTIKKMNVVYNGLESIAHKLHMDGLEREIQNRSLMYSFDSSKLLRRINHELDKNQIANAERDLHTLERSYVKKTYSEPDSEALSTKARFLLAKGDRTSARVFAMNALKWNPYNPQALEIIDSVDGASATSKLRVGDVKPVSNLFPTPGQVRYFEYIYSDSTPEIREKKLRECNQLLAIIPNCTTALLAKAAVLQYQKKTDEAMHCYELAIASDKTTYKPLKEYADFLSNSDYIDSKPGQNKLRELAKTRDCDYIHGVLADMLESEAIATDDDQEEERLRKEEVAEWDKAIKFDPTRIKYRTRKGDILTYLDRYKEAISEYKKALTLDFDSQHELDIVPISEGGVRRSLAEAYSKLGEISEAENEFSLALAKDPNDEYTLSSRAEMLSELKRYKDAIPLYTAAIARKRSKPWDQMMTKLTAEIYLKLFASKSIRGTEISMQDIDDSETSNLLNKRGNAYKALNDFDNAFADFQEALALDYIGTDDEVAHLCCKLGQPQRAIDVYTAVIAKKANRPHLHLVKAILLEHVGKKQESEKEKKVCIDEFEKLVAKDPSAINAFSAAQAYIVFEDYSKAESAINMSLKLESDDASYKIALAKVYAGQKRTSEALEIVRTVPTTACSCSLEDKAEVLQACGKYSESLGLLDISIKEDAESAKSYFLRSAAYRHEGQAQKAEADLKKAKELGYDRDPLIRLSI